MVVLPAPEGPTSATTVPARRERDPAQHLDAAGALEGGDGLERGDRDLLGGGVAEAHVAELDGRGPRRDRRRVGRLFDHGVDVEDLEDPLEAHDGAHEVDLHVGELHERREEAGEVGVSATTVPSVIS